MWEGLCDEAVGGAGYEVNQRYGGLGVRLTEDVGGAGCEAN